MLKVQFGAGNLQLDLINEVLEPWVQIVLPEPPYRYRSREREPQQPDAVVEDDQASEHAWKAERQRDHGRKIQEGDYPESSPREPQGREHRSHCDYGYNTNIGIDVRIGADCRISDKSSSSAVGVRSDSGSIFLRLPCATQSLTKLHQCI